jgi:hypothetical protein
MHTLAIAQDQPRLMPAEFQPAIQAILSILADIDFAHEHELEKVERSVLDERFKTKLIAKLNQLHRQRRQPYAHELLYLQERTRSFLDPDSRS